MNEGLKKRIFAITLKLPPSEHAQSLPLSSFFLSVTQEGNRTHHFNPPLGWAPRLFRAINPQRCRWSNQHTISFS